MANELVVAGYPRVGNRTPSARAQRAEHWRRVLARQEQSGLSRSGFCRREGIKAGTLHWWASALRGREEKRKRVVIRTTRARPKKQRPAAFLPVRVIQAVPTALPALEVVTRGGSVIRLGPGIDPETLRRAVAALEGPPC